MAPSRPSSSARAVIRAGIEAGNSVGRRVARSEHQDAAVESFGSDLLDEIQTARAGQAPIDDQDCVLGETQEVLGVLGRPGRVDEVAVVLEAANEHAAESAIVFNYEEAHVIGSRVQAACGV